MVWKCRATAFGVCNFSFPHTVPKNRLPLPLDLLVKDAVEAWKIVEGKASMTEMAKKFKRRKMHELPDKMLPGAVAA